MRCKFCKKFFKKNKSSPHKIFCSKRCREKQFYQIHPDKYKKYNKKYRLKCKVLCRHCNLPIANKDRASGVTYCSDNCRTLSSRIKANIYRKNKIKYFWDFKIKCGCAKCGYNIYGGALDFHHISPSQKDARIMYNWWTTQFKEIQKCIIFL